MVPVLTKSISTLSTALTFEHRLLQKKRLNHPSQSISGILCIDFIFKNYLHLFLILNKSQSIQFMCMIYYGMGAMNIILSNLKIISNVIILHFQSHIHNIFIPYTTYKCNNTIITDASIKY